MPAGAEVILIPDRYISPRPKYSQGSSTDHKTFVSFRQVLQDTREQTLRRTEKNATDFMLNTFRSFYTNSTIKASARNSSFSINDFQKTIFPTQKVESMIPLIEARMAHNKLQKQVYENQSFQV